MMNEAQRRGAGRGGLRATNGILLAADGYQVRRLVRSTGGEQTLAQVCYAHPTAKASR